MRRLNIPLLDNPEVRAILDNHVPGWSELNKDHRTLLPYLLNTILSVSKDITEEHRELLSRFHLHLLPEYEPAYLYYERLDRHPITDIWDVVCTTEGAKQITDFEVFMTDTFNQFVETDEIRINRNDIIDVIINNDQTYSLLTETGTLINTEQDINKHTDEILSQWDGNPVQTIEVFDSSYALIPGACNILSVVDEYGNPVNYQAEEHTGNSPYHVDFDLNNNGIIDPDDIATIREYIGATPTADNIDEWNTKLNNFDVNKNGTVDASDIRVIEKRLWATRFPGKLITTDRRYALIKITYREITEAGISSIVNYNGRRFNLRTNTYGSSILAKKLGRVATVKSVGLVDRSDTVIELHTDGSVKLTRTIGETQNTSAIAWPDPWKWKPAAIETIDGILLLITQHENTVRTFVYDTRTTELDYTDSYIDVTISGKVIASTVDQDTNELCLLIRDDTGLALKRFSLEKNYWYYNEEENRIYTSQRYLEFTLQGFARVETDPADGEGNPNTEEVSLDIVSESIPLKIQNSIDDFMYNWGLERTPGNSNRHSKDLMRGFFKHLQGNDLQGMYYGIARMLGFSDEELEEIFNISEDGIVRLSYNWHGNNPIAFLVMDENDAYIYSFKYVKPGIETGVSYIDTPVILEDNRYHEFADELIPETVTKHFSDITPTFGEVPIIEHSFGFEWDLPGEILEDRTTDTIKISGNLLDLTECEFLLQEHAGKTLYIIYDTVDEYGNLIPFFTDKTTVPRYRSKDYIYNELPFYIEALSDTECAFSSEHLENIGSDLITEIINNDNSRWKDTIADVSYFDTLNTGGQRVRKAEWDHYWS